MTATKPAAVIAGILAGHAAAFAGTPSLDAMHLAETNRAFAVDLYRVLPGEGNVFFSPYSISAALGMTYAGAHGETATEMAQALHFDLPPERLHKAFAALMASDQTATGDGGVELSIANALWGQKSLGFRDEYLQLTEKHYGAGLRLVDFSADPQAARGTINGWVDRQTQRKIAELLKEGDVDRGTALVLTNAIYFKGSWWRKFDAELTDEMPFHLTATQTVDVDMMTQTGQFRMHKAEKAQVLCLPYQGEKVSMVVILPDAVDGLAQLAGVLTPGDIEGWIARAQRGTVTVFLPRFEMTSRFELTSALAKLGMKSAFSSQADFSRMAKDEQLAISQVVHEAFVEVNEEGTEAAGATGVVMARTAIHPTFRVDRPFLFIIRNDLTGSWLFFGHVKAPQSK